MKRISRYILSKEEEYNFKQFLKGELSSRRLAEILNISHTQVFNMTAQIVRQFIKEKKIIFNDN